MGFFDSYFMSRVTTFHNREYRDLEAEMCFDVREVLLFREVLLSLQKAISFLVELISCIRNHVINVIMLFPTLCN